jgi:Tfp pilus assembly protein PilP
MRNIAISFIFIAFISIPVFGEQALQNTPTPIQNAPSLAEEKIEKQVYIYNGSSRRDPFLSIIVSTQAAKKKKPAKAFVPPVEDYDINQFSLIAIVSEKTNKYALVGLPDGKYYTLKEGMTVGVNEGKVLRILPDRVIVREFVKDYRGKITAQDTTLKLRKEEEK